VKALRIANPLMRCHVGAGLNSMPVRRNHRLVFSVPLTIIQVTEAINVLQVQQMFLENGITLPGRSEVSLAATRPCRLQLCTVLGAQLALALCTHKKNTVRR